MRRKTAGLHTLADTRETLVGSGPDHDGPDRQILKMPGTEDGPVWDQYPRRRPADRALVP